MNFVFQRAARSYNTPALGVITLCHLYDRQGGAIGIACRRPQGPRMELQPLLDPVQGEMRDVDRIIRARLCSDVVLINELARYIVDSGGKRLRPAVVLLAARACGYTGSAHLDIAAIIEFIHTATLLHDDVV